jgi:hypothetical protein
MEFREMLGDPLTIEDPETHLDERFTEQYANSIFINLYSLDYEMEVSSRWKFAANQRYDLIISLLSALL